MIERFPQLLYRAGSALEIDGAHFDVQTVADEPALSAALDDGWHETTGAALDAAKSAASAAKVPADDAPPTRDELLQKAAEMGVTVDKRWGDARLLAAINDALKG